MAGKRRERRLISFFIGLIMILSLAPNIVAATVSNYYVLDITPSRNEVYKDEYGYSYKYNVNYTIRTNSNDIYLKVILSDTIALKKNTSVENLVSYSNNELVIKIKKESFEIKGSIEIPVEFEKPIQGDIGRASVVVLDDKMIEISNTAHSLETIVVVNESITISKLKVGSSIIEKDSGIAEYKITIKNPESKDLNGMRIIDKLPNKDFDFNIYDVRVENSLGEITSPIGIGTYDKDSKEFIYSINSSYRSTVLNIYLKVKYKNLLVDEIIKNIAIIEEKNGNLIGNAEVENKVKEEATGEFFGKKRASKWNVGYGGTVIWNIVMQNPTSSVVEELIVEDKFPYYMRLTSLDLGNYTAAEVNENMTLEVYIKTKQNLEYNLYKRLVGSEVVSDNKLIYIEDKYLTDDNYITDIKISIKNVAKELLPRRHIRFYTKVMPTYEDGNIIENNTILSNTAVFSRIKDGGVYQIVKKRDDVNYIRSYEGTISKTLRGNVPDKIGQAANYTIVAQATNTSELPNPVIWDRLPSNLEFKNYSISVIDRSGNKILTDEEVNNLLEFQQDGEILRWKLRYILPKGCRVRIDLETTLKGIAPTIVNNVGLSTLDISKVLGVQSVGFPEKNYNEDGNDYDGNGNNDDLYVGSSVPFNIIYTESEPPIIKGVNDITLKIGEINTFNLKDGIEVSDDYDMLTVDDISIEGVIGSPQPGTNNRYEIVYRVKDSHGNVCEARRVITVTNQVPIIQGLNDIRIVKGMDIDLISGVTAVDEEDGNITDKIIMPDIDVELLEPGIHNIYYKVSDSDGNEVISKRKVLLIDSESPVIKGVNDIVLKAGEVHGFNLKDGIEVSDDYDTLTVDDISIEGAIGVPEPGTNNRYEIVYRVKDSAGNVGEARRIVTVTNQFPTIQGLSDMKIVKGMDIDFKDGVIAIDEEDGDISDKIIVSDIDIKLLEPGIHDIYYKISDSDGNQVTNKRKLFIEERKSIVAIPPISNDFKEEDIELEGSDSNNYNYTNENDKMMNTKLNITVSKIYGTNNNSIGFNNIDLYSSDEERLDIQDNNKSSSDNRYKNIKECSNHWILLFISGILLFIIVIQYIVLRKKIQKQCNKLMDDFKKN